MLCIKDVKIYDCLLCCNHDSNILHFGIFGSLTSTIYYIICVPFALSCLSHLTMSSVCQTRRTTSEQNRKAYNTKPHLVSIFIIVHRTHKHLCQTRKIPLASRCSPCTNPLEIPKWLSTFITHLMVVVRSCWPAQPSHPPKNLLY